MGKFVAFIFTMLVATSTAAIYGYLVFLELPNIAKEVGQDTAEYLIGHYLVLESAAVFGVVGFKTGIISLKKFASEACAKEFEAGSVSFVLQQQVVAFAFILSARIYIAVQANFSLGSILSLLLLLILMHEIRLNYRLQNKLSSSNAQ